MSAPYDQRNPRNTLLYQLFEQHFDTFKEVYDQVFAEEYGYWRPVVEEVVTNYLSCGDYRCGVARIQCGDCSEDFFVPFSCKGRGLCPSCCEKRVLIRSEQITEELLMKVPHRHLVFSLPKALRKGFLYNRELLQKLPGIVLKAYLSELQEATGKEEARAGGVLSVHTFSSSDLSFHPHIHGIVTAGCFDGDEETFTPFMADQEVVRERAEGAVINLLRDEVPQLQDLIDSMENWEHSGFDCFLGRRIGSNEQEDINRLTCYILRPPFTLGSIQVDQVNGKFKYRSRNAKKECPPLDPLELMARICVHIPDKYKHTVFRYGVYSNAAVGKRKKEKQQNEEEDGDEEGQEDSGGNSQWARLMKKVWDVDPLECPACGGEMEIIAFVTDRAEIDRIINHCALDVNWRGPPEKASLIPDAEITPADIDGALFAPAVEEVAFP